MSSVSTRDQTSLGSGSYKIGNEEIGNEKWKCGNGTMNILARAKHRQCRNRYTFVKLAMWI